MIWFKDYSVTELAYYLNKNRLMSEFNIEILEIGADYLHMRMPVTEKIHQVHGIMHGGATCVLVETAGSVASGMCLDPKQQYSVGSQINVNHLRPVKEGAIIAKCKMVHLGRRKHVWDIPVYDEETGKIIAKGELTCAVLSY